MAILVGSPETCFRIGSFNDEICSQDIKETSDYTSFYSNNADNMGFHIFASNGIGKPSDDKFEKIIRESNADAITDTSGAMLIQDTECTKYVIDGQKACSMMYPEPSDYNQYILCCGV